QWRYPRPWSVVMDLGQVVRMAQEVSDQKMELRARVNSTEVAWAEMGDLDGARRRMLALEERLSQSQERPLSAAWAGYRAWILCAIPEEQAWEQAEALMAPLLLDTSGLLFARPWVHGILARVALLRGQFEKADDLARSAMPMFPLAPGLVMF